MYYSSYADSNGFLYCVKEDEVLSAITLDCSNCPYYRGSIQGAGRECEVGADEDETIAITDPYAYMDLKNKNIEVDDDEA